MYIVVQFYRVEKFLEVKHKLHINIFQKLAIPVMFIKSTPDMLSIKTKLPFIAHIFSAAFIIEQITDSSRHGLLVEKHLLTINENVNNQIIHVRRVAEDR